MLKFKKILVFSFQLLQLMRYFAQMFIVGYNYSSLINVGNRLQLLKSNIAQGISNDISFHTEEKIIKLNCTKHFCSPVVLERQRTIHI